MANPTGKGGVKKGEVRNPSGLSSEERQARDWVRRQLASQETREAGMAAYLELLRAKNPLIVKDFMDRLAGKAQVVLDDLVPADDDAMNALTVGELRALAVQAMH